MFRAMVRSLLRTWQYDLSNTLVEAKTADEHKAAIRAYTDKAIKHEAFKKWTSSIAHHSLLMPSSRYPSAMLTISSNSPKLDAGTLALIEEMYISHSGVFRNHTFFEILFPHESDFCGLEHNVLVALGALPECNEDVAVTLIAPLRLMTGLQVCHELRIPEEEVECLVQSAPPEFYKDPSIRKEWMKLFYEGNPGTAEQIYRYCYTYPQKSRDRNEVDVETVAYSLCNLAKLLRITDDSSKGAFFVPCSVAGRGLGVFEFGILRDVTEKEQWIIEMLANEIIYSIWAIDRRIHEDLDLQARAKVAFAQTECHEMRHILEEQQLGVELLVTECRGNQRFEDVRKLGEDLGRRLADFQAHLTSRTVREVVGPTQLLGAIRALIPEALKGNLAVAFEWPEGVQIKIPGSAAELATALAPLVDNALIYGDIARRSDPGAPARTQARVREIMEANGDTWSEDGFDNDCAALLILSLLEGDAVKSARADDVILHLEIFDCGDGPTGQMFRVLNTTPFGERLPSSKPTGGYGLLGSVEFLVHYYHATVGKGNERGVFVQIQCQAVSGANEQDDPKLVT